MIRDEPLGTFTCVGCGNPVTVYGDDRLTPGPDTYRCVRCLDPRQAQHDEFVEAERQLAEAS